MEIKQSFTRVLIAGVTVLYMCKDDLPTVSSCFRATASLSFHPSCLYRHQLVTITLFPAVFYYSGYETVPCGWIDEDSRHVGWIDDDNRHVGWIDDDSRHFGWIDDECYTSVKNFADRSCAKLKNSSGAIICRLNGVEQKTECQSNC